MKIIWVHQGDEILNLYSELNQDEVSISLIWDDNFYLTGDEFEKAIISLPEQIETFNMMWNKLGERLTVPEMIRGLEKVPWHVTRLDLSLNNFDKLPNDDIFRILTSIPDSVKSIIAKGTFSDEILSGFKSYLTPKKAIIFSNLSRTKISEEEEYIPELGEQNNSRLRSTVYKLQL